MVKLVKLMEQYLARLSEEEHKRMKETTTWLYDNGYIKSSAKLAVTRYALITLCNLVARKKAEQEAEQEVEYKGES